MALLDKCAALGSSVLIVLFLLTSPISSDARAYGNAFAGRHRRRGGRILYDAAALADRGHWLGRLIYGRADSFRR